MDPGRSSTWTCSCWTSRPSSTTICCLTVALNLCVYVYIYIYIHMYVYHVCMYIYIYIYIYTCFLCLTWLIHVSYILYGLVSLDGGLEPHVEVVEGLQFLVVHVLHLVHMYIYIYTYIYIYMYMYMYICTYVRIYIYNVYGYVCVYIYIYILYI